MFFESGMMLAQQATKAWSRKRSRRKAVDSEYIESWTMFVMLSFLEFLNVFRKWYDAGTTGQEGGGASMPEGMFERVESCWEFWELDNVR